jgi:uncharacterized protein (DUF433 family)
MSEITVSPDVLGGIPVFSGTRVPVQALFDHLEAGDSLDVFLESFPDVRREQAISVLEASAAISQVRPGQALVVASWALRVAISW